ncbi:hypothetical protein [Psychrobacter alimentarius]|uniref:hypothetical protein n=1 Tax=Psychrobacter alimentarius TaxID=261164 RepID=UPI0019191F88|nr:hypothetical protein [Psychrobacter alimentarius]
MKTIASNNPLRSKLWLALLVGAVSISACSNEVEETPDSTMEPTEPVGESDTMASTDTMNSTTMNSTDSTELAPVETSEGTDMSMSAPMDEPAMAPNASMGTADSPMSPDGTATDDMTNMGSTDVEQAPAGTAQ